MSDTRPTGTTHDPDAVERYTDIILNCLTNAPDARAGARLAVFRITDELRKAMVSDDAIRCAVNRVDYFIVTEQHHKSMRTGINAAWDAVFDDEGGARP